MSRPRVGMILRELKRRRVFRVIVVYAVVAFIVVQVANNFFPVLQLPAWTQSFVAALAIMGLPLAIVLAWAFELTPDGVRRTQPLEAERRKAAPSSTYRVLAAGVGAGILIGLVSFGGLAYLRGPGTPGAGPEHDPPEPDAAEMSIAVLAFEDLSPGRDQAWFADGIAEEILAELTRVEGLGVTSRQSSFAFRGTDIDPRRIGDTLGVERLLTGSVRSGGDSVWVTPQLIDAGTGFQLWSETYARVPTAQNLRAIQNEIAREVASALALRFRPAAGNEVAAVDNDTYEMYLQARSLLRRRQTGVSNPGELLESLELLRNVVSRSPEWAPGWAALGEAGHWAASGGLDPDTHYPESRAALERALELDPDHPQANASLGFVLAFGERDYDAAEAQYRRAFELDRNLPWHGYAILLISTGRHEEAPQAFRRAEAHDPMSLVIKEQLVRSYVCARRFDEAVTRGRQLLALGRESPFLTRTFALALERTGQHEEARALLESRREEGGGLLHPEWVLLSVRLGLIDEAEKALLEIEEAGAGDVPWAAPGMAATYAVLDRRDAALEALESGLREPHDLLAPLGCYPELDALHGDPRYERILDLIQAPGR